MRHTIGLLGMSGLVIGLSAANAEATDAGAPPSIPACVQVTTSSRYVPYGYNHVVIIKNGCARAATCDVATDVNPERQKIEVPSAGSVEVTTFMGSASSTFTARVSCTLRPS